MNKTASEIADAVLEKLAVSPGKAYEAMLRHTIKGKDSLANMLRKHPRTATRARSYELPTPEGVKRGLIPQQTPKELLGNLRQDSRNYKKLPIGEKNTYLEELPWDINEVAKGMAPTGLT